MTKKIVDLVKKSDKVVVMEKIDIIITRHEGLVEFLKEQNFFNLENVQIVPHATPESVKDKIVLGVLPLSLAHLTKKIVCVNLNLPLELRGKELSKEQTKEYFVSFEVFQVTKLQEVK